MNLGERFIGKLERAYQQIDHVVHFPGDIKYQSHHQILHSGTSWQWFYMGSGGTFTAKPDI